MRISNKSAPNKFNIDEKFIQIIVIDILLLKIAVKIRNLFELGI